MLASNLKVLKYFSSVLLGFCICYPWLRVWQEGSGDWHRTGDQGVSSRPSPQHKTGHLNYNFVAYIFVGADCRHYPWAMQAKRSGQHYFLFLMIWCCSHRSGCPMSLRFWLKSILGSKNRRNGEGGRGTTTKGTTVAKLKFRGLYPDNYVPGDVRWLHNRDCDENGLLRWGTPT
jgi:hypothetical protein